MVRFLRIPISVLVCAAGVGCASVAPLDDATLKDVRLASPDDMARYARAEEIRARETFGGAVLLGSDGNRVTFTAAEYDRFLAYTHDHPTSEPDSGLHQQPAWPMVRLSFNSRRMLFDPDASSVPMLSFFLCDANERHLYGFRADVMWHDRFVTLPKDATEIARTLSIETTPQEYEVFVRYVYWDSDAPRQKRETVTLLPLPNDLCIAFYQYNSPLPPSVGRPLRISKDLVNSTVGSLPRTLTVP